MSREVEVSLVLYDLPDILQAEGESMAWQLVLSLPDQCILPCTRSQKEFTP